MVWENWFEITDLGDGIWAIRERLREGTEVKSFVVEGDTLAAVIDTGAGVGDFPAAVRSVTSKPLVVLQTHGHWDHIGSAAAAAFERVLIHAEDAPFLRAGEPNASFRTHFGPHAIHEEWLPAGFDPATSAIAGREPDGFLHDGERIDLGGRELEVIHLPGHAPGNVALLDSRTHALFPGDVVKQGYVLLMLERGDPAAYRQSLARVVARLDDIAIVHTAHGAPMTPDDVRALHEGYEQVWAGAVASDPAQLPAAWLGDYDAFNGNGVLFITHRGAIGSGG